MSVANGAALQQQALQWECQLSGEAGCLSGIIYLTALLATVVKFDELGPLGCLSFRSQHDCLHCIEQHLLGVVASGPSLSLKKASLLKSVRFSLCKQYPHWSDPIYERGCACEQAKTVIKAEAEKGWTWLYCIKFGIIALLLQGVIETQFVETELITASASGLQSRAVETENFQGLWVTIRDNRSLHGSVISEFNFCFALEIYQLIIFYLIALFWSRWFLCHIPALASVVASRALHQISSPDTSQLFEK